MNLDDLSKKIDEDFHNNKLLIDKEYENVLPTISNKAKIFIQSSLTPNQNLYILIEGGGCHGLQYKFLVTDQYDHEVISLQNNVFVDKVSLEFMWGSVIDVIHENGGKSLHIINPYAKQSCGCRVSFSI